MLISCVILLKNSLPGQTLTKISFRSTERILDKPIDFVMLFCSLISESSLMDIVNGHFPL